MSEMLLSLQDLTVSVENKPVIEGLSLSFERGKTYAIMGPNGSGKSSLAYAVMGHPRYVISSGNMVFDGHDLLELSPDKRAKLGVFLALQSPYEIEGVTYKDFLRHAYNALYDGTEKQLRLRDFHAMLLERLKLLNMSEDFINRSINVGFSGGEKKRAEMLQIAVLQPRLAILDEIDSGLDVDALKDVCRALKALRQEQPDLTIIMISHYKRLFDYLKPDHVFLIRAGALIQTGGIELVHAIEEHGYLVQQGA